VPLYPQLAERLGLSVLDGAMIDSVQAGGPANKAGLRGAKSHITFQGQPGIPVGGDVIVAVDGRPLTRPDDLANIVATHRPGETVTLQIVRGGKHVTVPVKLAARPKQPAGAH
jgi:2-alkenal reductase